MDEIQSEQVITIKTIDIKNTPKEKIEVTVDIPTTLTESYSLSFIDSQIQTCQTQIDYWQSQKDVWVTQRSAVDIEVSKVKI